MRRQVVTLADFDGAEDMSSYGDVQLDEIDGHEEHGGTQACS